MLNNTIASFECQVIIKEYLLVGESITANFPQGFPKAAIEVAERFNPRRDEVMHAKDKEIVFCPYMCNDILATYMACLEVDKLEDIPEGMVGFHIPESEYAMISCSNKTIGEGYDKLFKWMAEKGFKQRWYDHCFPIEIYYYEENVDEERVEILIPIK